MAGMGDNRTRARGWLSRSLHPGSRGSVWPLLLAVATGVAAGVGAYTFSYAKGLSYFGTDPQACVNCHIMEPQYAGWQKSSHHAVARCIDCHLPSSFFPKYLAKAENGYRHGKLFTTQTFEEPISIKRAGRAILQANCENCHADLVHDLVEIAGGAAGADRDAREPTDVSSEAWGATQNDRVPCVHCHWTVGHGERAGLGGPRTSRELMGMDEP
jgi:cytochrome c nitrite reductase small subunit